MAAFEGNQNGVKLKDPKIRQAAYQQYCAHLAKGKSKKSWYFDHPELRCTWETMEKYIKDEMEFDPLHKKMSEAQGYAIWEQVVEDSARGLNKEANTATLQMLMRNKYGWDKVDHRQDDNSSDVTTNQEKIIAQLSQRQKEEEEKSSNHP